MYYVNEDIKDLYRVKHNEDRSNVIRLDMNENPIGLPEEFVSEIRNRITGELLATYPSKKELTKLIGEHIELPDENIIITAGSEEAIRLIFQCFSQKNQSIVKVSPSFEMYDVYAKMYGIHNICVEYDDNFRINSDKILEHINWGVRIVVLLNPNSPIGTCFTYEEIEKIIQKAKKTGAIVVVDEAYYYFYTNSAIKMIKKFDNLVIIRTFSKLCSLAGLRIGYAVANKQIVEYMEKASSTFNVSSVSVLFATELLKKKHLILQLREKHKEGYEWMCDTLRKNNYRYFAGEGNYILFYPNIPSDELVDKLKAEGIWIRDYGKGILKGWARITTAEKEIMEKVWSKIMQLDNR